MKKGILILILNLLFVSMYAQEEESEDEVKTLISKFNEVKGFGALEFKGTEVASKGAMVIGAYGGVTVNKQFMIGVGGYGVATNVDVRSSDTEDVDLEGGYGGVMLGFIIAPREVVHVTIPVFIGGGSFHQVNEQFGFDRQINNRTSSFAVVEPGVQLEVNISKGIRLNFGASYRYIQGTSLGEIRDEDLSGFTGNVTLKIGKF